MHENKCAHTQIKMTMKRPGLEVQALIEVCNDLFLPRPLPTTIQYIKALSAKYTVPES